MPDSNTPTWPEELPSPLRNHRRSGDFQSGKTEMESGRVRTRRLVQKPREILEVIWNFTEDQFDGFKDFFEQDLENGSLSFFLDIFGHVREVEFFEPIYSHTHSDSLFSVSANLLLHALGAPVSVMMRAAGSSTAMVYLKGKGETGLQGAGSSMAVALVRPMPNSFPAIAAGGSTAILDIIPQPASCAETQPPVLILSGINSLFCGEETVGECSIGSSCEEIWNGEMWQRGDCEWTNEGGSAFGCLFGEPVCGLHLAQAIIQILSGPPIRWELYIEGGGGLPVPGSSGEVMWIGEKIYGDGPLGEYTQTGGCCVGPEHITVVLPL